MNRDIMNFAEPHGALLAVDLDKLVTVAAVKGEERVWRMSARPARWWNLWRAREAKETRRLLRPAKIVLVFDGGIRDTVPCEGETLDEQSKDAHRIYSEIVKVWPIRSAESGQEQSSAQKKELGA